MGLNNFILCFSALVCISRHFCNQTWCGQCCKSQISYSVVSFSLNFQWYTSCALAKENFRAEYTKSSFKLPTCFPVFWFIFINFTRIRQKSHFQFFLPECIWPPHVWSQKKSPINAKNYPSLPFQNVMAVVDWNSWLKRLDLSSRPLLNQHLCFKPKWENKWAG